MTQPPLKLVVLLSTLRRGSFHRALARSLSAVAPVDVTFAAWLVKMQCLLCARSSHQKALGSLPAKIEHLHLLASALRFMLSAKSGVSRWL